MMIDRNHLVVGLFLVLLAASTGAYAMWGGGGSAPYDPRVMSASSTPATDGTSTPDGSGTAAPSSSDHSYGTVTIKLNEVASFPDGLSLRLTSVLEDSRCPSDVQCIQAGTVRVSVRVGTPSSTTAREFKLGSTVTTDAQTITFTSVAPGKNSKSTIAQSDYSFTFKVVKRADAAAPPSTTASKQCYVGGCSSQLCTDNPKAVSTCEYTAQYACYKTAKCERQTSGQCGWTQTSQLASCLANPPGSTTPAPSPSTNPGSTTQAQ